MRACVASALAVLAFGIPVEALAIRPFVTDDARVVGHKLIQLETWALIDRTVAEHNALVAFGPSPWLEVTAGFFHGGRHAGADVGYSITGPVLQLKALALPATNNGVPGVALSLGVIPPAGHGAFVAPGWTGFSYVAFTESLLDERILFHANLGVTALDDGGKLRTTFTTGVATQVRVVAGLHGVGEIFYGDPYDPRFTVPAMQVGARYIFNDNVQIDGTFGSTLRLDEDEGHVQTELWGTFGIRLVSRELY